MTRLEMVEKIREKTGVTYEEAREALEKANWDMLDAMVFIEKDHPSAAGKAEAKAEQEEKQETMQSNAKSRRARGGEAGDKIASVLRWLGNLIRKGERVYLDVSRKDETVLELSMVTLILLFLVCWWIPAILIVAGLFTGYKFRVTAGGMTGRFVNSVSEKASAAADDFKNKMNEDDKKE